MPNLVVVVNEVAFNNDYAFPLYTSESSLYTPTGGMYQISYQLEHYKCMVGEAIFYSVFLNLIFVKTVIPRMCILEV